MANAGGRRSPCTVSVMKELLAAVRPVIVAAHPDDEVIGAGGLLRHMRNATIIHTTNGSPRDLGDAQRAGFATREAYADARRKELRCALRMAGEHRDISLDFIDQETMLHLPELCDRLDQLLRELQPDVVLTQPYEGGHPDHDSTAFAVHRVWQGPLIEMTSYHARDGHLETGVFLRDDGAVSEWPLSGEDAARKAQMLGCFTSQQAVLANFPVVTERFRRAPHYNFAEPPHAGVLHYETLPWGITGERWRALAAACR